MTLKPILRLCVSCRKKFDRNQLLRVTKSFKDGVISFSGTGRSAYLCINEQCLQDALKRKRFSKSLRCNVDPIVIKMIEDQIYYCNKLTNEAI